MGELTPQARPSCSATRRRMVAVRNCQGDTDADGGKWGRGGRRRSNTRRRSELSHGPGKDPRNLTCFEGGP